MANDPLDRDEMVEIAQRLFALLPGEQRRALILADGDSRMLMMQPTLEQLRAIFIEQLDLARRLGPVAYGELSGRQRYRRAALPDGAADYLMSTNPRLQELRQRYADHPATAHSKWNSQTLEATLDLGYFRADNPIIWQKRGQTSEAHYLLATMFAKQIDALGLLGKLKEDGAFGVYSVDFDDALKVSRDLLESVIEINFLERHIGLSKQARLRVVDIGAGYGRLGHRMAAAFGNLDRFYCMDAVPESTFLSEYYIRHRNVSDRVNVVPLHEVDPASAESGVHLVTNIHSFSECPSSAIDWWFRYIEKLRAPYLLIVPNDAQFLALERNGERVDFSKRIADAGYELMAREPYWGESAQLRSAMWAGELHLFRRTG